MKRDAAHRPPALVLATRDTELEARLLAPLERTGVAVEVARTNLELVFRLTSAQRLRDAAGLIVDCRACSLGHTPLHWLREDPVNCGVVALVDADDSNTIEVAELAGVAAVFAVPEPDCRGSELADEIARVFVGPSNRDLLRWTPPRAPPRLRRERGGGASTPHVN